MAKAQPIVNLKCDADATTGARLVLLSRVREVISLRDKAFDWSDTEGVHDMRVASRRLRSALRDFGLLFPKRDVALLGKRSKIIADHLGSVRDEDVAIIALEKLRFSAPSEMGAGLKALIAEREERRRSARVKLVHTLTPERLGKLLQEFTDRIGSAKKLAVKSASGEGANTFTFRDLGHKKIGKQFTRFGKRAVCLYHPLASGELHELRIEAKRLRYALELFGVCWEESLTSFAEEVAEIQGALGDLHDYDEWIIGLGRKLAASHDDNRHGKGEAMNDTEQFAVRGACVWLLDHFAKERTKSYRRALAIWTHWQASSFAANLNSVIEER